MRTLVLEMAGEAVGEVDEDGAVRSEDPDIRNAAAAPGRLEQVSAGEQRLGTRSVPVAPGQPGYLEAVADVLTWSGFDMRIEDR